MDFETMDFYVKHFRVGGYWIAAAVIGLSVQVIAFIVALSGWLECKGLWAANQTGGDDAWFHTKEVDYAWLGP